MMDIDSETIYKDNLQRIKQYNIDFVPLIEHFKPDSSDEALNVEYFEGKDLTLKINGIQLTSRHDRILQLDHMCQKLEPKIEKIDVYGIGLGDVIPYLNEKFTKLKLIKIHILNLELFNFLLTVNDFLFDLPKVKLVYDEDFITVNPTNLIFYPEVLLADKKNRRLAEHLEGYLDLEYCKKSFEKKSTYIIDNINKNHALILSDPDISELFGKYEQKVAVVVGSGPSLKENVEKLKSLRNNSEFVFVTVDTALNFIHSIGIHTDYLVSIDHLIDKRVIRTDIYLDEILAYSPSVKPELCTLFNKRYVFYSPGKLYDSSRKTIYHSQIFSSGSVIHSAVDLACKMGVSKIILFGCDFAFLENCSHAISQESKEIENLTLYNPNQNTCLVEGTNGQLLTTLKNFRYYLHDLEYYISKHSEVTFLNASKSGAKIRGTQNYE